VSTTLDLPADPTTPAIKKIMNNVFTSIKNRFTPGQYSPGQIMGILKEIIVNTTNDLLNETAAQETA